MPFKPHPKPTTPQSAKAARGDTAQPPMNEGRFGKAGLPEGLRSAFGPGKRRTAGPSQETRPAASRSKPAASKPSGY
jgi:hypothetical protein